MKRNFLKLLGVTAMFALAGVAGAATAGSGSLTDTDIAAKAAHEIRMYPRYTIWDNISVRVNGGNAELMGQVSQPFKKADLQLPLAITADWDILGLIYIKMGDLVRAESYLAAAWHMRQEGLVGDHLGQVYEQQRKLSAALHMYDLALEANPRLEETPSRIRNLGNISLHEKQGSAREELNSMRTVQLPTITKTDSTADFDVLLAASGKIDKTNFLSGSDILRGAGKYLESTKFAEPFPTTSTARLVRKGNLSCSSYAGCNFVFYPLSVVAGAN